MIVFITGATAGFGAAIARHFAQRGDKVVATGRRRERLDALHGELGDKVLPLVLDVRDREAVGEAFANLPPNFAEVDVLVNNAGLALGHEPAQKSDHDDWDTKHVFAAIKTRPAGINPQQLAEVIDGARVSLARIEV